MLDNKTSDRERLLKLIDGGPEVVKEVEKKQLEELDRDRAEAVFLFFKGTATWMFQKKVLWVPLTAGVLILAAVWHFTGPRMKPAAPVSSAGVISHPTDKSPAEPQAIPLKLVGVDWSSDPVALIEDSRSGKTYFAKKNDSVNDAKVKQIMKDKVVIQYHHQTVELKS